MDGQVTSNFQEIENMKQALRASVPGIERIKDIDINTNNCYDFIRRKNDQRGRIRARGTIILMLILDIVVFPIAIILTFGISMLMADQILTGLESELEVFALMSVVVLFFGAIILNVLVFLLSFLKRKKKRAKIDAELQKAQEDLTRFQQEREAQARIVLGYISFLPMNYRYLYAVTSILSYFENQRADNLKEAINLYEQELYQIVQNSHLPIYKEVQWQMNHKVG